jgi:hypothetical protein
MDIKNGIQRMMVKTLAPGNYAVDCQGKVYDRGLLCATMGDRSEGVKWIAFMVKLAALCEHKVIRS